MHVSLHESESVHFMHVCMHESESVHFMHVCMHESESVHFVHVHRHLLAWSGPCIMSPHKLKKKNLDQENVMYNMGKKPFYHNFTQKRKSLCIHAF